MTLLFVADVLEPLGRVDEGVEVARVSAVGEAEGNRVNVQRGAVHIQHLKDTDTSTVLLRECETSGKNLVRIVFVIRLCKLCASDVIAFETRYECSLNDLLILNNVAELSSECIDFQPTEFQLSQFSMDEELLSVKEHTQKSETLVKIQRRYVSVTTTEDGHDKTREMSTETFSIEYIKKI